MAAAASTLELADREARRQALELENAGRLPAGYVDHYYPLTRLERLELARLAAALRMARDVEAWADLLCGVPVDPSRLHREAVLEALEPGLVRLVSPLDLVNRSAA